MPRLSDQTLLKKEPYRSILNLLSLCGYLNGERTGLQHAHFLYALKEEKLKMNFEKEKEMKQFFDQFNFKGMIRERPQSFNGWKKKKRNVEIRLSDELKQGCITRPQRLNDALALLINKKWIEPKEKPRYRKYYLTRKYWTDLEKRNITYLLNVFDQNTVITGESLYRFYIKNPDGFKPEKTGETLTPFQKHSRFVLCGIPIELIKNLSDEEKKNLNDWLITIETHLWKIMELKYLKTKVSVKEYIEKELQKETSVEDLIRSNHIGFYYTARKSMVED
jgi:hypothetical protein